MRDFLIAVTCEVNDLKTPLESAILRHAEKEPLGTMLKTEFQTCRTHRGVHESLSGAIRNLPLLDETIKKSLDAYFAQLGTLTKEPAQEHYLYAKKHLEEQIQIQKEATEKNSKLLKTTVFCLSIATMILLW